MVFAIPIYAVTIELRDGGSIALRAGEDDLGALLNILRVSGLKRLVVEEQSGWPSEATKEVVR